MAPLGRYTEPPAYHVVRKGETLYAIAWRYGLDYRRIATKNGIGTPYTIFPGQHLRLVDNVPGYQGSQPKSGRQVTPRWRRHNEHHAWDSAAIVVSHAEPPVSARPTSDLIEWQWPTRGKLVNRFSDTEQNGIDVSGTLGQPIFAAATGQVVYSGGGLSGYGELIIIRHDKHFLSAYAYNNKLLIAEGDRVIGGQRIAEMGRSRSGEVMLHFEIRRDGRPVNPMRYLPKLSLKEESHVERARDG